MKSKRLPAEKLARLVLVVLAAAVILAALGFGLIAGQYAHLSRTAKTTSEAKARLQEMEQVIRLAADVEQRLLEAAAILVPLEQAMAGGDVYAWMYTTLRRFKVSHQVEVEGYATPEIGNVNLLPGVAYKQAAVTVYGSAYFHDLGGFLAEIENELPHVRVVNLHLQPRALNGTAESPADEKLAFKANFVALIRPEGSAWLPQNASQAGEYLSSSGPTLNRSSATSN